jgi:hypothetical protein
MWGWEREWDGFPLVRGPYGKKLGNGGGWGEWTTGAMDIYTHRSLSLSLTHTHTKHSSSTNTHTHRTRSLTRNPRGGREEWGRKKKTAAVIAAGTTRPSRHQHALKKKSCLFQCEKEELVLLAVELSKGTARTSEGCSSSRPFPIHFFPFKRPGKK